METKQCIACKEDILQNAVKCKHCYQVQNRSANLKNKPWFNHFGALIVGSLLLWLVAELIILTTSERPKPVFQIKSPKLQLSETKEGLNIRCIATAENTYLESWSDFSIQAKFKNASGDVIDIMQNEPSMTVLPSFNFEVMASGMANAAKEEYSSCELTVLYAD
jgi:hypothetical protein